MFDFGANWAQSVADISGRPEYQTARIRLLNPNAPGYTPGEYDVDTGQYGAGTGTPVVWEGPARVIGVRWGVNNQNVQQANPTTIAAVRVQIPYGEYGGHVGRGWTVDVVECPRNPALISKVLTVTSDLQGSSAGSRTFECSVDLDGDDGDSQIA